MGKSSQVPERLVSCSSPEAPARSNEYHAPEWLVGPAEWRAHKPGALIIGGDYKGLGTVRSLGRRKIPVWVLTGEHLIAGVSRYAQRRLIWPDTEEERQVEYLLRLGVQHNLRGWVLFPSGDETAATVARHHSVLRKQFRLTVPPWDVLQWAYDKRLTYRLAPMVGVDIPRTHTLAGRDEVARLDCAFPVVLKPAVKPQMNRFTAAKAWRVEDRQSLLERYDEACTMVDPGAVLVQELIPGGGQEQFSYAALCLEGRPLAALVARRTRQFPSDFGRSSTKQDAACSARSVLLVLSKSNLNAIRATVCTSCWISTRESGAGTRWAGARVLISHFSYGGSFKASHCRKSAESLAFAGCVCLPISRPQSPRSGEGACPWELI